MRQDLVGLHGYTPPKGADSNKGTVYLKDDDCFLFFFREKANMTFDVALRDKLDRFARNNETTAFAGYPIVKLRIAPDKKYVAGKLMIDIANTYDDIELLELSSTISNTIKRRQDPHACYSDFCKKLKGRNPKLFVITNFYEEIGALDEVEVFWLYNLVNACEDHRFWICAERGWYKGRKTISLDLHQQFEAVPLKLFEAIQEVKTPPYVYFSYSWEPKSDDAVNVISDMARLNQLPYRRDKDHCSYRANITKFMDTIREGKYVVVLFSKAYLESYYCMYELTGVLEHLDYEDRIFPIVVEDEIRDDNYLAELDDFWKEKRADTHFLKTIKTGEGVELLMDQKEEILNQIVDKMSTIKLFIRTINELKFVSHVKGGYKTIMTSIIDQINSRYDSN